METINNSIIRNEIHLGNVHPRVINLGGGHCQVIVDQWIPKHVFIFDYTGIIRLSGNSKRLQIVPMKRHPVAVKEHYYVRYVFSGNEDDSLSFYCSEMGISDHYEA